MNSYNLSDAQQAIKDVAAGPRILNSYNADIIAKNPRHVAAGPRIMNSYNYADQHEHFEALRLDREF